MMRFPSPPLPVPGGDQHDGQPLAQVQRQGVFLQSCSVPLHRDELNAKVSGLQALSQPPASQSTSLGRLRRIPVRAGVCGCCMGGSFKCRGVGLGSLGAFRAGRQKLEWKASGWMGGVEGWLLSSSSRLRSTRRCSQRSRTPGSASS